MFGDRTSLTIPSTEGLEQTDFLIKSKSGSMVLEVSAEQTQRLHFVFAPLLRLTKTCQDPTGGTQRVDCLL